MATIACSASFCAARSRSTYRRCRCSPSRRDASFRSTTKSTRASVIVIGRSIAESLFPHVDAIGKQVRLNGRLYEVIGLFEPDQGLFSNFGVDQFATHSHE